MQLGHGGERVLARGRLAEQLELGGRVDHLAGDLPEDELIVDDQDPDWPA